MSKQLTFSAVLSTMAMAALVIVTGIGSPSGGSETRSATAHGSIISVLLRA